MNPSVQDIVLHLVHRTKLRQGSQNVPECFLVHRREADHVFQHEDARPFFCNVPEKVHDDDAPAGRITCRNLIV